jgi:hypothetical protein
MRSWVFLMPTLTKQAAATLAVRRLLRANAAGTEFGEETSLVVSRGAKYDYL